jgi:heme/copper-type cytochrome/quinol oxidase subunit 1
MSGEPSPVVPSSVNAAFWLYIAGAAVGLVSVIVGAVVGIQRIRSGQLSQVIPPGTDVSPTVLNTALTVGVALAGAVGLISVIAYVVFALQMRRGANWARIVLTVLSAIALVSGIVGLLGLNVLNLLVSVLVVVAAVLLWQRSSNAYFVPRTAATVQNPYG